MLKTSQDVDVNLFRKCYFANQDLLNTQTCLKINDVLQTDLQPRHNYTIVQNSMLKNNSVIPNKPTVAQIMIPSTRIQMALNNNQLIRNMPQQGQQIRQISPQTLQNFTLSNQTFPQTIKISPSKLSATNNMQCRTLKTINGQSLNIMQRFSIPSSQVQQQQATSVNVSTTVPKILNAFSLESKISTNPHFLDIQTKFSVTKDH